MNTQITATALEYLEKLILALHFSICVAVRQNIRCQKGKYDSRVRKEAHGDVCYSVDLASESIIDEFFSRQAIAGGVVIICEGLGKRVYPPSLTEEEAAWRIIIDPLDGTRHIMYDNRSAWVLTGVAPNLGGLTNLQDVVLAVQTEVPPTMQSLSAVLVGVRGGGVRHSVWDIEENKCLAPHVPLSPSQEVVLDNGFVVFPNFFPGTKAIISAIEETVLENILGPAQECSALVFSEQYISSAGQIYMLISGRYRVCADIRAELAEFQQKRGQKLPMCAHPYDLATCLIAEELGIVLVDGRGRPLAYPLDTKTNCSWVGYANKTICNNFQPVLLQVMQQKGIIVTSN
ncbi:MAG: hypothetical protein LBR56_02455 [Sporomusaceae bacterium]|jgi:hypothetical protein|nr:hypothetical protein [Sporomusaceae bacterium]